MTEILEVDGTCPICEQATHFTATNPWLRDHFICLICQSVPRERALIATLNLYYPGWRRMAIHECSPALRASAKLSSECAGYVGTHYDRTIPFGSVHPEHGYRSEDLESQTFPDDAFDLVITQDVFEHLFRPDKAMAEIARTLKAGGAHVCTLPIGRKSLPSIRRADRSENGLVSFLEEPIYHGNPIDASGSLVTFDYGYDICEYFDIWSGLNTTMVFIDDISRGIRAEFIEVLLSRKSSHALNFNFQNSGRPKFESLRLNGSKLPEDLSWIGDSYFQKKVLLAEERILITPPSLIPSLFEHVPTSVFALLFIHRPDSLPNISNWLPRMPSEEDQLNSTGEIGEKSMLQAAVFVDQVVIQYQKIGGDIKTARVLDYAICWARLARLFYKFTSIENIYGVDAWESSLDLAKAVGFRGKLALIDSKPHELPFSGKFDVVYCFSLFTHISESVSDAIVSAIRKQISARGVFALTIRPRSFHKLLGEAGFKHCADYDDNGFAFTPEPWATAAGNLDYGNTSISLEYIESRWKDFCILGVYVNERDPYQLYVFLTPQ